MAPPMNARWPGWVTNRRLALGCAILMTVPFWMVTIVPLTDAPGHMGRAAIAAFQDDPAFRALMGFHWYPVPNLGVDLIVEGLRHVMSITRAYWLAAAAIPLLLTLGLFATARRLNPEGAAALPWALLFVWCFPFNYGFLNYMLGVALSFLGFALWMRLDAHPRVREVLTWIGVPLVFLCHAVGGSMLSLFIASREFSGSELRSVKGWLAFIQRIRPLIVGFAIIVIWRLSTHSIAGATEIGFRQKFNAIDMMLRDQNIWLDVGSLIAVLGVYLLGRAKGARIVPALLPAILFLIPLFIVMPSRLAGSHFADMRIAPLVPMLVLLGQDWRGVERRIAMRVTIAGFALLALRLAVTTLGFVAYDRDYRAQLGALDHIPEHSVVIALSESPCNALIHWRNDRRGHLAELLQVYRRSWSNGQWDTDGGHLTQVRWRPSEAYYHDPSQHFWGPQCLKPGVPDRWSFGDAMAALPFGRFDYLWMIGPHPDVPTRGLLVPVWSGPDGSILYRASPKAVSATPAPISQPPSTSLGQ
jgi:hypothetical protein